MGFCIEGFYLCDVGVSWNSSLAACGLTKKPEVQIVDIDVADANNELAAIEYTEDMYKFYKLVEQQRQWQGRNCSYWAILQCRDMGPEVNDSTKISENSYTNQQVLVMEKKILGGLEWNLIVPTPYE
ncbi:hypothetical protein AgCh_010030 [Apium graveolens]